MNLYKFHSDPTQLLYSEDDVMASMIDEMIDQHNTSNNQAISDKTAHHFEQFPNRNYDIEEWLLNGDNSTFKDIYIDEYAALVGVKLIRYYPGIRAFVDEHNDQVAYDHDW